MREENNPVVADELVEVNRTVGGIGFEVGGNGAEAQTKRNKANCVSLSSMALIQ